MKRCCAIMLLFSFLMSAAAQETPSAEEDRPSGGYVPINAYIYEPIRKGDQFIRMGIQLGVPLFNTSLKKFAIKPNIYPGGNIFLGYEHYLTKGFAIGADLTFSFYPTLGSNLYFAIPFTFTMGYTFTSGKMRFPMTFGVGGNYQGYNGTKYFGMIFRMRQGIFYQYSPEWSFGGEVSWEAVPQWYKNPAYTRTGNFLTIGFAARYHF